MRNGMTNFSKQMTVIVAKQSLSLRSKTPQKYLHS